MNQPGRSDLPDVVDQRVQQPLGSDLRPAAHRESSHALCCGDIGEYRFHDTHTPGVHPSTPFGIDTLAHLLRTGSHRTVAPEEPAPGRGADQTASGENARTAVGPLRLVASAPASGNHLPGTPSQLLASRTPIAVGVALVEEIGPGEPPVSGPARPAPFGEPVVAVPELMVGDIAVEL